MTEDQDVLLKRRKRNHINKKEMTRIISFFQINTQRLLAAWNVAMHFLRESLLLSLWLKYMWQFPGFAPAILHSCEAESPSAGVICS